MARIRLKRSKNTSMLKAALAYAKRGIPVFPIYSPDGKGGCDCGTPTCKNEAKHPRTARGFHDATTNIKKIQEWWGEWPRANVAMPTGEASGYFSLDIDLDKGKGLNGYKEIKKLEHEFGSLPKTPTFKTGRGGEQQLFSFSDKSLRCTTSRIAPGIDTRGGGGYVLLPPSKNLYGDYSWIVKPGEKKFKKIPLWLSSKLHERKERAKVDSDENSELAPIPSGSRNQTLASIAGTMRRAGLSEDAIIAALNEENRIKCSPPLENDEVLQIARSISQYKPGSATTTYGAKGGGAFKPVKMVDLIEECENGEGLHPKWLLEGFIPTGGLVMIAGAPKTGKTTFAAHITAAIRKGKPFAGLKTTKTKVLWLGLEERAQDVARRFKSLGVGKNIRYLKGPFKIAPNNLSEIIGYTKKASIGLIVVDTLAKFWNVSDENAAAQVDRAVDLMLQLAHGSGAAVLLLHHCRKSSGGDGEDIRGSSAIFGNMDVAMLLRRSSDTMRDLKTFSRFDETPEKMIVELKNGKYRATSQPEMAAKQHGKLVAVLTSSPQTSAEIADKACVPETTVRRELKRLAREQPDVVIATGGGRQGDAKKFALAQKGSTTTKPL